MKYSPIDIVETNDGYLILASEQRAESNFNGTKLIAIDEKGDYLEETSLDENNVLPTGDFLDIEGIHYFLTMNPTTLSGQLVTVGDTPQSAQTTELGGGIQYPLALNKTSNNELLVLSYHLDDGSTVLSRHDLTGALLGSGTYTIGAGNEVEDDIINHYLDPDRSGLPFSCGEISSGSYYFNGFYNYSFSMVFTKLSSEPTGVIQGQGANGGLTAILPLEGGSFSMFGFQFNDNFVQAKQSIDINATTASIDYLKLPSTEFIARSHAKFISYEIDGTSYSVLAAETQTRQIGLYFYDVQTGLLAGIHHIGYLNPFNLGGIKVDDENNLIVTGSTLISGRFERVFLTKVHEQKIASLVK